MFGDYNDVPPILVIYDKQDKPKPIKTVYQNSKHQTKSHVKKEGKSMVKPDSKQVLTAAKLELESSKIKDKKQQSDYIKCMKDTLGNQNWQSEYEQI